MKTMLMQNLGDKQTVLWYFSKWPMKVICKYIVFMLFIYNFNIFNIDAEKPFSGTLNKVYVCKVSFINASKEVICFDSNNLPNSNKED